MFTENMDNYDWEDNFDEGDDNFGGEAGAYSGKNVIMFVVYGGEGMHVNSSQEAGGQTLFQRAIEAAADTYKVELGGFLRIKIIEFLTEVSNLLRFL